MHNNIPAMRGDDLKWGLKRNKNSVCHENITYW